ncbi:MAG: hypothetical protein MI867_04540, partial [Pseudomonadales bacterium]|nr:hypothetical protein [Pseudomonadales bacterium]
EAAKAAEAGIEKVEAGIKKAGRLFMLGELAMAGNDLEKARTWYTKAVEAAPENFYFKQKLQSLPKP